MKNIGLLIALLCAACSSTIPSLKPYHMDVQQGNVVDSKMMGQLRPGMTKSQVRFILGTPLIQDSFHKDRWDYFYQMRKDGKIIEQRRVILDFENESLKGVRGDVIPAGTSTPQSGAAPMATLAELPSNKIGKPVQAENKKGWVDKLKFWEKSEKPAEIKTEKPVEKTVVKPQTAAVKVPDAEVGQPAVVSEPVAAAVITEAAAPIAAQPETVIVAAKPADAVVAPVSEAKPTSYAKVNDTDVVTARVNAWADAWRKKDINSYLSFYADSFVPESSPNKKVWATQRKQRLSKSGSVKLVLSGLQVEVNGDKAVAEFLQRYSSNGVSENVSKVLQLQLIDNNWLIVKESAASSLKKSKLAVATESSVKTPTLTPEQKSESMPQQDIQAPMPSPEPVSQEPVQQKSMPQESAPTPVATVDTTVKSEVNAVPVKSEKAGKEIPDDTKPGFFERMLEKIGF